MTKVALLAAALGGLMIGLPAASAAPLAPSAKQLATSKATDVTFWRGCDRRTSGFYSGFTDPYYSGYYNGYGGSGYYGYSGFYDAPFVGTRRAWRNRGWRGDRHWRHRHRPSVGVGVTF
ncbi:MAG: hypothetical protein U1E49_10730 [Hyphomicrobiaceae bacterium]